jgi:hypothetical protein
VLLPRDHTDLFAPGQPSPVSSSADDEIRAVAAELGLARAIAVLEDERGRVRRLISG